MKLSALLCMTLVSVFTVSVPAASAEERPAQLCSAADISLILSAPGKGEPGVESNLISALGSGGVQYKDFGCTAFYDCPSGQRITCSGANNCGTTTTTCSGQGSTCPDQDAPVGAVYCNGSVQASCPCPDVCFGCGHSCTTDANCASVCTCGGGRCSVGKCSCLF